MIGHRSINFLDILTTKQKMSINFNALIVNDNSSKKSRLDIKNLKKIKKIEILNLKQNCGNQIAIA